VSYYYKSSVLKEMGSPQMHTGLLAANLRYLTNTGHYVHNEGIMRSGAATTSYRYLCLMNSHKDLIKLLLFPEGQQAISHIHSCANCIRQALHPHTLQRLRDNIGVTEIVAHL